MKKEIKKVLIGIIILIVFMAAGVYLKQRIASQSVASKEKSVEPSSSKITETVEIIEYDLPLSNSEKRVEHPTHIVLHFTSNALNNPQDPYLIEDTYDIFKENGVSANYVIGRRGEVYSFVPEDRVAYHAGKGSLSGFPEYENRLNYYSIGIEILAIGTREEMSAMIPAENFDLINLDLVGYTEAQYQALNTLIEDIVGRYPGIKKDRAHIVGHDEYSAGRKTDPGSLFDWSKIGL